MKSGKTFLTLILAAVFAVSTAAASFAATRPTQDPPAPAMEKATHTTKRMHHRKRRMAHHRRHHKHHMAKKHMDHAARRRAARHNAKNNPLKAKSVKTESY